ncbi:MAG TPA: hypothetical protein VMY38_02960 [Gemmatimonadaceae bacterium]|nr:hypothetical protein [Gemmatimonadaceae bacterium]
MRNITAVRAALLAASLVAAGACGKKDAAPADTAGPVATPAATPLRVADIQLGKGIGSDKRVLTPTTSFGTRDTIYVSVTTDGAATDARLTATWMYNGTQGVSETDEMISSPGGTNVSEFHISKDSPWPTGSYRVDIKLNGASAGSRDFMIH